MPTALLLPQHDTDPSGRKNHLQEMREKYAYSLTYDGYIATINQLPDCEKPGWYYKYQLFRNIAGLIPSLPSLLWKTIKHRWLGKPFESFDDYIFFPHSRFPDPEFRKDFWGDLYFGRQCVAGANPVMLQGVNAQNPLPKNFKVNPEGLSISPEEYTQALSGDRLYMVNYESVKPLTESLGEVDGSQKYLTAPIALLMLQDDGNLKPVAIQLDVTQPTSSENPIITPPDKQQWKLARSCIQAADGTVHDLITHAVDIHYVMESIIMVSYRQLGMYHPLLALLDPHLQYTLNINVHPLYEPDKDGTVPSYGKMFPPDNPGLVKFMGQGMANFKFRERAFPNDLKRRHVENSKLNYPYRDDGWPLWNTIQEFTREYVDVYYKDDQDVIDDHELQAWAHELTGSREQGMCGLNDFPEQFQTVSEVAETIGQIIFTATAHHSAIHYPQHTYAQFVPNMPLSLYQQPLPLPGQDVTDKTLLEFFPRFNMAFQQAMIYYVVDFKVNRIGEYELKLFDESAVAVIENYQQKLNKLSAAHSEKYKDTAMRYPFMDPEHIPNGVTA